MKEWYMVLTQLFNYKRAICLYFPGVIFEGDSKNFVSLFYFRRYTLQLESASCNLGYTQSLTFFWILYFVWVPRDVSAHALCKWEATNSFAGFVVNPSRAPRFWKALRMDSPLYYFVLFSNTIQLFYPKKKESSK